MDIPINISWGKITPDEFISIEHIQEKFDTEWRAIARDFMKGKEMTNEDKEVLELIGKKEYDRLELRREKSRMVARAIDAKVSPDELTEVLKAAGWRKIQHSILEPKNLLRKGE